MKKLFIGMILATVIAVCLLPVTALTAKGIDLRLVVVPSNGGAIALTPFVGYKLEKSGDYTITGTWDGSSLGNVITVNAGVTANITLYNVNINVSETEYACAFDIEKDATVNLTLNGNNVLRSGHYRAGLHVPYGATLKIFSPDTGSLESYGSYCGAGIGGNDCYNDKNYYTVGTIEIHAGTVNANGGSGGAGIGGGGDSANVRLGGFGGTVNIYGGTVNANGDYGGAGIGGGGYYSGHSQGGDGGTVTIYDGIVNAKGSYGGAGIGGGAGGGGYESSGEGGRGGTVNIYGGTVTAIGSNYQNGNFGSGIGVGGGVIGHGEGGAVNITGGTVDASGGWNASIGGADNAVKITGGNVKAPNIVGTLTDGDNKNVYRTTLTLDGAPKNSPIAGIGMYPYNPPYGLDDVVTLTDTDGSEKLYLYLTDGTVVTDAHTPRPDDRYFKDRGSGIVTNSEHTASGTLYQIVSVTIDEGGSSGKVPVTTYYPTLNMAWGYATSSNLPTSANNRAIIKLLSNSKTTGPLVVKSGNYITLDLNGYTIDRGLTTANAEDEGNVITVNGDLLLKDSRTNGAITGGNNSVSGGGVIIDSGGTFTMSSGSISGNKTQNGGGGVSLTDGVFTMTGGTITGNTALNYAGGVFIDSVYGKNAAFNMEGGEITGNHTTNETDWAAGGVFVDVNNTGRLNLKGKPVITGNTKGGGNTPSDLHLNGAGTVATLTGPLSNGANIGVTKNPSPTIGNPVSITNAYNDPNAWKYFKSSGEDYFVSYVLENSLPVVQLRHTLDATAIINGVLYSKTSLEEAITTAIDDPSNTAASLQTITSIEIPSGYVTEADWTYIKDSNSSLTSLNSLKVADAVTSAAALPESFLDSNTSLNNVDISKVASIGDGAFSGCSALQTAYFPDVETIGASAFNNCTSLSLLGLPASPPLAGENAFSNCPSDGSLTFLNYAGVPLTGDALDDAVDAYRAHVGYNSATRRWYG